MSKSDQDEAQAFPLTRRDFIRITGAGASITLAGSLRARAETAKAPPSPPMVDVGRVSALKVDVPVNFTYPDDSSPAILVRLSRAVPGGVGPNQSIVAYSMLCTHKGCPVSYKPERKLLICPCHWSSFDPAKSGQMVIGQGSQALPQIALRVQGDAIQAIGVEGLIYGRHTNIL